MEDRRKRRSRSIAIAAVVCVVALVAIGVMMWHPWDTGVPAGPESGGEEVAATDDAGGAQGTEGDTPEMTDEPSQDGGQQEEAWPGQFSSDGREPDHSSIPGGDRGDVPERPKNSLSPHVGGLSAPHPRNYVTDENGCVYAEGLATVIFYKSVGEGRMRQVVEEAGCTWIMGSMNDYTEDATVEIGVPVGSEKAKVQEFESLPEVMGARLQKKPEGSLSRNSPGQTSLQGVFVADVAQKYHLYAARF